MIQNQERWDRRYLELAKLVSTWSKDPSTKVGAVLVRDNKVVGTGYNGFPRHVNDYQERYDDRDTKYKFVVHAELNAILQAGDKADGATLYVYPGFDPPYVCSGCAKAVIQSGVSTIVSYRSTIDEDRRIRWKDELYAANQMIQEAMIFVTDYEE